MKKIIIGLIVFIQVTYAVAFSTISNNEITLESAFNKELFETPDCSNIQGYDKYIIAFYFLGPNVNPPPNPNRYPNPYNSSSVTVWAEVAPAESKFTESTNLSPSSFESFVRINANLDPNDRVCGNSIATYAPMASGTTYRAVIFYKSWTLPPGAGLKIRWSY